MFKCSWLNVYSLTDPMPKGFLTCSLSKSTGFLGLCLTVPAVDSLLRGAETAQWLYLIEKKTHSLAGQLQRERAKEAAACKWPLSLQFPSQEDHG